MSSAAYGVLLPHAGGVVPSHRHVFLHGWCLGLIEEGSTGMGTLAE